MNTLKSKIEQAVLGEYDTTWKFLKALHIEGDNNELEVRASAMLTQALREYSSQRHYARKWYENISQACTNNIKTIDNNETISWGIDSDRVNEYNSKATAQVEVVRAVVYIIGLEAETVQALFAALTKAGE